jgi:Concanavalin A-like lectin/glucanases superfamily
MVVFSGLTLPHVTTIKQQKTRNFYELPIPNRAFDYRKDLGGQGDTFTIDGWLQSADATARSQISALVGTTGILDLQEPTYQPFNSVLYYTTARPHTVTVNGPTIDNGQSPPFGTGAGKFVAASSQYLSIPAASDFNFGAGNFTIDFDFKLNSIPANGIYYYIMNQGTSYTAPWQGLALYMNSSGNMTLFYQCQVDSTHLINCQYGALPPFLSTGVWYHLAQVRNGNNFTMYLNGSSVATVSSSLAEPTNNNSLLIGGQAGSSWFNGWLKEFRVSKGIARWMGNFTPPTAAYTPDVYTGLLLHMESDFTDASLAYNDVTAAAQTGGSPFGVLLNTTDFMYFGSRQRWNLMQFILSQFGSYSGLTWKYSQGGGSWNALSGYTDGTNGLSQNGSLTFTPPSDWAVDTLNGVANMFWLRVATSSITTAARLNQLSLSPCYNCLLLNPLYTLDPNVWDYATYELTFHQIENP